MDTAYLSALGSWLATNFNFPAIVFSVLLCLAMLMMWKAQKNPNNDFNILDMLRDESGKPSAMRFGLFVAIATSTWVMMSMTISGKLDYAMFIGYIAIFVGGTVGNRAIEAWGQAKVDGAPPAPTVIASNATIVTPPAPPTPKEGNE